LSAYDFILRNWYRLELSPPVKIDGIEEKGLTPNEGIFSGTGLKKEAV